MTVSAVSSSRRVQRWNWREIVGSLRFRLTLWNTTVVFLMILLVLISVREGLRVSLEAESSQLLKEDAEEVRLLFQRPRSEFDVIFTELDLKALTHTHRKFYVRIFDENLKQIWASRNAPEKRTIPNRFLNKMDTLQTFDDLRFIHVQPRGPNSPRWTIRVATSFAPIEYELQRVTALLIAIGGIMLVISPLGGYWLAGRATAPLVEIIRRTDQWHPREQLYQRLPLRDTNDELDRLSRTINDLLDRLAQYIEQNREFTAHAAHELRSPLAGIQSAIEVALNVDRTLPEYQDLLADLLVECQELSKLVNQLLLLAESDAGILPLGTDRVVLSTVVLRAVEMFQGVAESRDMRLDLQLQTGLVVPGDASRLRQVLNNLLDNAVKYSRTGALIQVQVTRLEDPPRARIAVTDQGAGIPEGDLPHIFERFYRGDRARHRQLETRGSGLGLSICQAIVKAHEGHMEVTSTPGQGSCFAVILPLTGEA